MDDNSARDKQTATYIDPGPKNNKNKNIIQIYKLLLLRILIKKLKSYAKGPDLAEIERD